MDLERALTWHPACKCSPRVDSSTQKNKLLEVLFKYFGHQSFRKGQLDTIKAALENKDVLTIMPTGSGKSLCFQLPAIMQDGLTVVISPLISLMKDQLDHLKKRNVDT